MGVNIGTRTALKIYLGEHPVKAIYKGSELVWVNDFNITRFHTLCPAATATAVTFDYKAAIDVSDCTLLGYIDTAETIEVWNKDTEYFVLSDYEIRPRSCASLFYNYKLVTSINFNNFSLQETTSTANMFYYCSGLTSLDVSGFDTQRVTNMSNMFNQCKKLTSLDVSGWNTSNVKDMNSMFYSCSKITSLDVSGWNTSNVTNMSYMFTNDFALSSLDVSGWNTSNVTNMSYMFYGNDFSALDVSGWNTSKVTKMDSLFSSCSKLTLLDVSGWNTSKVTNMGTMFSQCRELTSLDISGWNTSNVTNMSSMFNFCQKLNIIKCLNQPETLKVTSSNNMFYNCIALIGGNGTKYDSTKIDKTYFRIDTPETPGYLTLKQ